MTPNEIGRFLVMGAFLLGELAGRGADLVTFDRTGRRAGNSSVDESFAISGDGRFAAFSGFASNYVAGDSNLLSDVFVRDCVVRSNVWDTTASRAAPSPNKGSYPVSFTPDGRFLLFISRATNLVSGVSVPEGYQLYLRDLVSNVSTLVSVSYDGRTGADNSVYSAGDFPSTHDISSDGRFVSFTSAALNLAREKTNFNTGLDVFCRDTILGVTELVTVSPAGRALDRFTSKYTMSTNGRYFSFETSATNVVAGISNITGASQVYWRDREAGTNVAVALALDGTFAARGSFLSAMSGDGRYVCFSSLGTNYVTDQNDQNAGSDLFIRDMQAGETWLVSRGTNGGTTGGQASGGQFSANGEWLLFSGTSTDLVPGVRDANGGALDVFVHHVPTRTNAIVSRSYDEASGAEVYLSDSFARISSTGRFIVFTTTATNLIRGVTNHSQRLLVRDQRAGRTLDPLRLPALSMPAFNGARFIISEDERLIFFLTFGNPDPAVTGQQQLDLYRTALFAPRLAPPGDGRVEVEGLADASYILQSSSNLVDWASIATNAASMDGQLTIGDPVGGNQSQPRRFYRLVAP